MEPALTGPRSRQDERRPMPRQIYSSDVHLWATMYVVANTKEEAQQLIAQRIADGAVDAGESADISGKNFASSEFPRVSFSPAMTIDAKQTISLDKIEQIEGDVDEAGSSEDGEDSV